jgi:mRNA interferase RelE/StbE
MRYDIGFKPRAVKDLTSLPKPVQRRIIGKVERLRDGLAGEVKRLTDFTPEFRLRVGDYRVLFEVEADRVVIYRILHRKDAYR